MPATSFVRPPWASPRGVSSRLVEPPAAEPLTRAEAKLRAGLDWAEGDPRDALMDAFIAAARQQVEQDTGLALLQQTRLVTIVAEAGEVWPIPMQTFPCQSITPTAPEAPIFLIGPGVWEFPVAVAGTWTVVSGWPTPAALLREAPLLVQAVGLLVAHLATLGRDLASIDQPYVTPLGYEDAIAPFRLVRVI